MVKFISRCSLFNIYLQNINNNYKKKMTRKIPMYHNVSLNFELIVIRRHKKKTNVSYMY